MTARLASGKQTLSVVTLDITDQQASQQRNELLLREMTTILENTTAGMAYLHGERLVRCNATFEAMLVDSGLKLVKLWLDVSKDEQAERLQARLDDLQRLFDAAREVAIIAFNTQGRIEVFNRGAEAMLGYTAQEAMAGMTIRQFYPPGVPERMQGLIDAGDLARRATRRHGDDRRR
mgnify:CR=1 FL=1